MVYSLKYGIIIYGPRCEKTCLPGFANTQAQTSLRISAFVIHFLESTICKLAIGESSIH